jgi:sugar phosphate isomerase/epimerase
VKPIALQLYSVREYASQDFPGTLRKVAEMGYKGVETAGLHGHDADEIRFIVNDLGMEVCSCHGPLPVPETVQQIVDEASSLGSRFWVSGFGPNDFDSMEKVTNVAEKFEKASQLLKEQGITFAFHNHWWELHEIDGKRIYDVLMDLAPSIMSELDVYWTAYGKSDPVQVIREYGSRLPLLHIKDGPLEENQPHTAVGSGKLDIPAIIGAADPEVTQWLIVELDHCATDMMEAVQQSYAYLTSNGLAAGNK